MVAAREDVYFVENRTSRFIVLSLVLHGLAMLLFSQTWFVDRVRNLFAQAEPKKNVEIEMVPLTHEQLEKIKAQIVETALTQKAEKAAEDAYLGLQTQVVHRQTRAKEIATFRDGKPAAGAKGEKAQPVPKVALGNLGVHMDFKPMGNLGPGETAATSDYLKDVKEGAQTMLNTKEYAYFSFYQRVRRQLEQYWEPGLRARLKAMFARGRQLAADREHSTRVMVVMDKEGVITKILVQDTSGLVELDQAAIDAFNRAGPFPNPPKGMVEADGTVKVEWEFILKT